MIPPCLTLSIIRYGSRVKWSNPWNGVAPSPTPWCSSYRKGSLRVTLVYGRQLYFYFTIYIWTLNTFSLILQESNYLFSKIRKKYVTVNIVHRQPLVSPIFLAAFEFHVSNYFFFFCIFIRMKILLGQAMCNRSEQIKW